MRRGREGLRDIKPDHFVFKRDAKGVEYVEIRVNETEKSKQGHEKVIYEKSPVMYAEPGEISCPVASLRKYIAKRNEKCSAFYQYPSAIFGRSIPEGSSKLVWYDQKPIGKNTLGSFMATISEKAELPVVYTNHCIRATAITKLSNGGIEANDIVTFTGHKSIESLRMYQAPSTEKKRTMSNILHKAKSASHTITHADSDLPACVTTDHVSVTPSVTSKTPSSIHRCQQQPTIIPGHQQPTIVPVQQQHTIIPVQQPAIPVQQTNHPISTTSHPSSTTSRRSQ